MGKSGRRAYYLPIGAGERLWNVYLMSGKSMGYLAKRIGCDRKTVFAVLHGQAINITFFARLCKELKVSTDYILYGKEN